MSKPEDYATPFWVWKSVIDFIPSDKKIYEPFYYDGASKKHFKKLGYNIIHEDIDFFKSIDNLDFDVIITHPPSSKKRDIVEKLLEIDKPFMLLMSHDVLNRQWFRKLFINKKFQIIIPLKRIQFENSDGQRLSNADYECLFFCYKMDYIKDISFAT